MAAESKTQRPPLRTGETLDAKRLHGFLDSDGVVAVVKSDNASEISGAPMTPDTMSSAGASQGVPETDGLLGPMLSQSNDLIESYDDLRPDPDTLISNTRRSLDTSILPAGTDAVPELDSALTKQERAKRARLEKQNSIHIKLEKTEKRGRYVLTADDPELKEILKKGLERQELEAHGRKPRLHFRDLVFTRQFTTFDRQNPDSQHSAFFGFFTLFWICMSFVFCQMALKNYREYGSILGRNQVAKMMFSRDVAVLGLTDGAMYLGTFVTFLFQKAVRRGWFNWAREGWILQNLWQTFYLASVIGWAYFRDWPWTHVVFAALHGLVFLMKQHSYAFYNGYLSGVLLRKALLERKLKQLESIEPVVSPPTSPFADDKKEYQTSTGIDLSEIARRTEAAMLKRRTSQGPRTSVDLHKEDSDVAQVAAAIESGKPIDAEQMHVFSSIIKIELEDLEKELQGKSETVKNAYPNNLRVGNFAEYICLPTLVYELEYPRQESTNWWYVLEKTTATFGVLFLMQVISQAFIYPVVVETMAMKDAGMTLDERWREFPYIVSDMLFPLLIEQLLTWYLIWECILNVLAEVTRFADRGFYGDWWNSVTWDQYARDWNRPVHNFLLRHVYHSSISTFHLSRNAATFVTFLLSALVHEMVMALIFKKVRGYLFWLQLSQMPLVAFSRSKLMRGRVVLGNVMFWVGLFIGPSLITCLYLVV